MKIFYFLFAIVLCNLVGNADAQIIPIAGARSAAMGDTVTITGIVTNGAEFGPALRYVQDSTGGIAMYGTAAATINRGDSVVATGIMQPYEGLTEISLINVTDVSSGNALPLPKHLNIIDGFAEQYECQLVVVSGVSVSTAGNFAPNTNYNITDGVNIGQIRINGYSNLSGVAVPIDTVSVTGIMGHYKTTFQLLPRDINDIPGTKLPPVFFSLVQSNITSTGFSVSFATPAQGNSIVLYGTNPDSLTGIVSDTAEVLNHTINLTGLQPATIYYVQGLSISAGDTLLSIVEPMATASLSSQAIKIYFNRSVDTTFSSGTKAIFLNQTLQDTIVKYIGSAQSTLDILMYDVDNENGIVTAINNAVTRGVQVRVILNYEITSSGLAAFAPNVNKIFSPTGGAYNIMHNKIMIIDANSSDPDAPIFWTGSTNWTNEQVRADANNVIIFQDQTIARAATLEFNEMWGSSGPLSNSANSRFGPYKVTLTPSEFLIAGKKVELYFSPVGHCDVNLANAIHSANKSVEFAIYEFTKTNIADSLKSDYLGGASIQQGLMDDTTQAGAQPIYDFLRSYLTTKNIKLNTYSYLLHDKYAIIDAFDSTSDPQVETGSFNWTNDATLTNDENQVIVHDATIANLYFQNWAALLESENGVVYNAVNTITKATDEIFIFPNPASGYININYDKGPDNIMLLRLINVNGRTVKSWNMSSASGRAQLDIQNIPSGTYFLNINSNSINRTLKIAVN